MDEQQVVVAGAEILEGIRIDDSYGDAGNGMSDCARLVAYLPRVPRARVAGERGCPDRDDGG